MMQDGISVVIPNYNGAALLPQILPAALQALEHTGLPFEIIVADDCSTDNSVAILQEHYPSVKRVRTEQNGGFSITANTGIAAAGFSWVLLLNSDVKLEPDYFEHLLPYRSYRNIFGVMGRIINWNDEGQQDGAKYPKWQGCKIKTSSNYVFADETANSGCFSWYLSGANCFLNKQVFDRIGGFNEMFSPFYVEDTELSLRAWRLGYQCWYENRAVCRHKTSTTIRSAATKKYIDLVYNRNKFYLHALHLTPPVRYGWWLQTIAEVLAQTLLLRTGYLMAFGTFLRNRKKIMECRRRLQTIAGGQPLHSLQDITETIKRALQGKNIRLF